MNSSGLRILVLLFLCSGISYAQVVRISGSGKGYAGAEIKLFTETDPVTKSQRPFSRVTCDQKGTFALTLPVKGSATVFLKSGVYTWFLYVTEGKDYSLSLADFIPKPAGEEQNPYFEEIKIMPEVVNDTSDINNLIRKFDSEYNPAFNRIADRVAYNIKRSDIPSIIENLNSLSFPGATSFFSDFVKFRMIMINMVGSGEYKGRVEDSVLINSEFAYGNPAYTDLLEQRFSSHFATVLNGPHKNDFIRAVAGRSFKDLKKVILANGSVSDEQLAEYIILMNLYPAWFDGSIPGENIISLISSMTEKGSSQYIRDLSGIISASLLRLRAGSRTPDFVLRDNTGAERTTSSFEGKYLLLSFTRSDNAAALTEFSLLNAWYKKYSSDLNVVTILTDRNFSAAVSRMKSAGFGWTMLDGSLQDMVEYLYNIRMYPSFILIDRKGNIITVSCPYPSENLERIIAAKIIAG